MISEFAGIICGRASLVWAKLSNSFVPYISTTTIKFSKASICIAKLLGFSSNVMILSMLTTSLPYILGGAVFLGVGVLGYLILKKIVKE